MDYTELLKENELLKAQLADYETRYKPVYDKHMQSVKEQALASYGLQADAVWLDRITADTEEGIAEQVQALAVDLRIQENNAPKDPSGMGNFAVRSRGKDNPRATLYELGRQMAKQANGRHNPARNSIKVDTPPVKAPQSEVKKGIIQRWLGR